MPNCPTRIAPFVERACTLPAMPEVAHKLLQSFDREDLPLPEIAGLIGRDQTLAAKVLRLANSPRYWPSHTVTSLGDASASLGLRALRDLTLSASMVGAFPALKDFDRLSFWRGTLAVAAYAQPIARALDLDGSRLATLPCHPGADGAGSGSRAGMQDLSHGRCPAAVRSGARRDDRAVHQAGGVGGLFAGGAPGRCRLGHERTDEA